MAVLLMDKERSFYEELQSCTALDLRDPRGRRHSLAFVLLTLTLALLRGRDGNLSSTHRSMRNTHQELCIFLGEEHRCISRSHLSVFLEKVCVETFDNLLFTYYGLTLNEEEKQWFSGDGKELRGSIPKGKTRGQAIVQLVSHEEREVIAQNFYDGLKESEKPALRHVLSTSGLNGQKITLDALHLCPATTELIAQAGGVFVIGLKENQPELMSEMLRSLGQLSVLQQCTTLDLGHGRIEERNYQSYCIRDVYMDKRWQNTHFELLIKVTRTRTCKKTDQKSREVNYYLSNGTRSKDIFNAIRKHWSVEVNNHLRDVTLNEDHMRSKKRMSKK
jgi:predicted transposase YbfD/YdcC